VTLLTLSNVSAGYRDTDVVSGVDLYVDHREIVAVAGTNGAGKSTIVKAIMGLTPRLSGSIKFDGQELTSIPVEKRVSLGLSYVPQVHNVFGGLSVLENLLVVERVPNRNARVAEMFDLFPALAERKRTAAGDLSGGERQQLAFARALMSSPRLIVLDEPSAALSPMLTEQVFEHVRKCPEVGAAVLIVEQRARQAIALSSRGYVMDAGRVVLTDTSENLLINDRMAQLYLGKHSAAYSAAGINKGGNEQ
jgi:ABC-type branched-subunit amino acid transport system ATPase component